MPSFTPNNANFAAANQFDTMMTSPKQMPQSQQYNITMMQLNQQLEEIQRLYQTGNVPMPRWEYDTLLNQLPGIPDPRQRHIAQHDLLCHMRRLVSNR